MNKIFSIFIYVLIGLMGGIVFPPFNKMILLSLVCGGIYFSYLLYGIVRSKSARGAFLFSWGLGFLSYIISFSWLVQPFEFVGASAVAPLVVVFFDLCWSVFFGIVGLFTFYIKREKQYCGFAILFTLIEWVKSWIFTGFPWNPVALVWSNNLAMMQSVSVIGTYGLGFITISFLCLPYLFFERGKTIFKSLQFYCVMCLTVVSLSFGYWRIGKYKTFEPLGKSVKLVNRNVVQQDKYDISNIDEYIKFSKIGADTDIVIWSETAVPVDLFRDEYSLMKLMNFVGDNKTLITGFDRVEFLSAKNFKLYNVMAIIDYVGISDFYDKRHLVPFGEYIPFKKLVPFQKMVEGMIDFSSGEREVIFDIGGLKIYPVICYEAIFSGLKLPQEVDFIVNISNDKWFAGIGKVQHFDIVKFRAVEEGVPVVRVANDGISAVISPLGSLIKSIDGREFLNESGIVDVELVKRISRPFFSKTGNLLVVFLLICGVIWSFYSFKSFDFTKKNKKY